MVIYNKMIQLLFTLTRMFNKTKNSNNKKNK